MRTTWLSIISVTFGLSSAACGSTRVAGQCPDKPILDMCSTGFYFECETTGDGCEQCSCVPISDDQGRPSHDP